MTAKGNGTIWRPAETALLVSLTESGVRRRAIAATLDRSIWSVRWKQSKLRLTAHDSQVQPATPRRLRQGDRAFIAAMTAAIASGAEIAVAGIVKTPVSHYVRLRRPEVETGYRSSAAMAEEIGR